MHSLSHPNADRVIVVEAPDICVRDFIRTAAHILNTFGEK